MEAIRNRVSLMQAAALTEREVCSETALRPTISCILSLQSSDHWRREAEDNHRMAVQLEQEKYRAIQQRDDALHQIEQMRQLLSHKMRLLPSDQDLMNLTLDDVHSLRVRVQDELNKLTQVRHRPSRS